MLTFENLFRSYQRDVSDNARLYLQGLLTPSIRKNIEDISEIVPNGNVQNLQQFITDSKWSAVEVMSQVAKNVNELIGDAKDTALLIDESGIPKKGKHSVGVSRQWLGCIGKVDNGQVGVYAALCKGIHAALVNTRLYLPESWINDTERSAKAKIPADQLHMRTKEELALEMIDDALEQQLMFGWVGADAGYGKGFWFMREVAKRALQFAVDVHCDTRVYLKKPRPYLPQKNGIRGRTPSRYVVEQENIRVDKLAQELKADDWQVVNVRDSSKGPVQYETAAVRVYVWDHEFKKESFCWWLVIRRNHETGEDYKYTLISAPAETEIKRLAYMQGQRYWIENAFEVCKSKCGMADYEVRSWAGWHHHMAMTMMAQLFLLTEKISGKKEYPLLSATDIMLLLAKFLPQRKTTVDDVIFEMKLRHAQRERTKISAVKKLKLKKTFSQ